MLFNLFKSDPIRTKKRTFRTKGKRNFAAAEDNYTLSDFSGNSLSIDAELVSSLRKMRGRSRTLANDNDYAKKYLAMVKSNVVGASGIILQAKTKDDKGELDQADNKYIEANFKRWGKVNHCTINKRYSWIDLQNVFIETVARDGEALCIIHQGKQFEYGISLQLVDIDLLDETYNTTLENGNSIRMGIEQDSTGKVVAYHILSSHPNDTEIHYYQGKKYKRILAENVIHGFISQRAGQSRGIPWMHTSIRRLNMLGGMEEAELVASRVAASKMGFFTSADGDSYIGDSEEEEGGALISDAEPGSFEQLPEGVNFQTFDPQHPSTAFDSFIKAVLRGAASGLNVAYNTLANDLEGVSYSSIRSGTIEERDQWKQKQTWMIEHFCERVYLAWIKNAILIGKLDLPSRKISKFEEVTFQARAWDWVDPVKDVQSNILAYKLRTTSLSDIAAKQGRDFADIVEQLKKEEELLKEAGLEPLIDQEKEDERIEK